MSCLCFRRWMRYSLRTAGFRIRKMNVSLMWITWKKANWRSEIRSRFQAVRMPRLQILWKRIRFGSQVQWAVRSILLFSGAVRQSETEVCGRLYMYRKKALQWTSIQRFVFRRQEQKNWRHLLRNMKIRSRKQKKILRRSRSRDKKPGIRKLSMRRTGKLRRRKPK